MFFFSTVNKNYAQEDYKPFSIGIKLGANFCKFTEPIGEYAANDSLNYSRSSLIRPTIGLIFRFKLSNVFFIQPELNYILKGGSYKALKYSYTSIGGTNPGEKEEYYLKKSYRLNYIEIPLLLSINLSKLINPKKEEGILGVNLTGGLAPAINTNSTFKYNKLTSTNVSNSPIVNVSESTSLEEFDGASKFVLNYIIDFSFNFEVSKQAYFLSIRFNNAITKAYKITELNGYNMNTKTSTVTVGGGIQF